MINDYTFYKYINIRIVLNTTIPITTFDEPINKTVHTSFTFVTTHNCRPKMICCKTWCHMVCYGAWEKKMETWWEIPDVLSLKDAGILMRNPNAFTNLVTLTSMDQNTYRSLEMHLKHVRNLHNPCLDAAVLSWEIFILLP